MFGRDERSSEFEFDEFALDELVSEELDSYLEATLSVPDGSADVSVCSLQP